MFSGLFCYLSKLFPPLSKLLSRYGQNPVWQYFCLRLAGAADVAIS